YLTYPAHEKADEVALFEKILLEERNLKFSAKILEVAIYENDELYWPEFYYEDGMVLNLLYEKVGQEGKKPKRAVGIKLSVGMEIPKELEGKFKFARQRSKLAGEIRGSYFTIKQEWL
ncbi:MAG: phage tail protein, partial [Lactococcus lactis]|nr:phage tail protein [Lactococcus lactis]